MSEGDLDFGTRGKLSARRATEAGLPGVPGLVAAVHRSSLTVMRAYGSPFPLAGSFIEPNVPDASSVPGPWALRQMDRRHAARGLALA
jgi:hypothetical protein